MRRILILLTLLLVSGGLFASVAAEITDCFFLSDDTLPVELSSFSAVVNSNNKVRLQWTTQSESNLLGYYVLRAQNDELDSSAQISPLINPTNSSSEQYYAFVDNEELDSGDYYYWLNSAEYSGASQFYGPIYVQMKNGSNASVTPPLQTGLGRVYPNPFNPNGTIEYFLKDAAHATFRFYNLKGQHIKTIDVSQSTPGRYSLLFNAVDANGREMPGGIYFVRMQVGALEYTQRFIIMK